MAVTLGPDVLFEFRRFTLYNSPFVAHDEGCAIDLYPDGPVCPSPVAGEVVDIREVRAPPKPYAAEHDVLVLVDTGEHVARLLHVDPDVAVGETLSVGDPLGSLVRAGFFAPWVPNHVHLGFRPPDADPYRASGSVRLEAEVPTRALAWDGTGTVRETGETWARLDRPAHPDPGELFVGLAAGGGVLDGGVPHYQHGGVLWRSDRSTDRVTLAGAPVGTVSGRTVRWHDRRVLVDGRPVTGLALYCARDRFGVKIVGDALELAVGDEVRVTVADPE